LPRRALSSISLPVVGPLLEFDEASFFFPPGARSSRRERLHGPPMSFHSNLLGVERGPLQLEGGRQTSFPHAWHLEAPYFLRHPIHYPPPPITEKVSPFNQMRRAVSGWYYPYCFGRLQIRSRALISVPFSRLLPLTRFGIETPPLLRV